LAKKKGKAPQKREKGEGHLISGGKKIFKRMEE